VFRNCFASHIKHHQLLHHGLNPPRLVAPA
jgi:hypothetical protein